MKKNIDTSKATNIPKNSSLIIFLFLISLTAWLIFLYFGLNEIEKGFSFLFSTYYGLEAFTNYIVFYSMIGFPILLPALICIIKYLHKYFDLSLICQRYLILCIIILSLKAIVVFGHVFSAELYEVKIFNFALTLNLSQIILLIIIILAFILIVISFFWRYIETKRKKAK